MSTDTLTIVGGTGGQTVIVKLQVFVFPLTSDAVQTTVVTPIGKVLPEGGEHEKLLIPHTSLAEETKLTTLPTQVVA